MGTHDNEGQGPHAPLGLLFCVLLALGCILVAVHTPLRAADLQTSIIISICGNGIVDPGEACDGGIGNNTGAYGSTTAQRTCDPGCQSFGPYCGDGILQARFNEQCDNGSGNSDTGLCSPLCQSIPAVNPVPPIVRVGSTPPIPGASPGSIPSEFLTQVVLRGKAYPNSDVNILLDGKPFGVVRADTNADFLYNTTSIPPGTATLSFWAKDSSGVQSLTTSVVFQVIQSAVTSVNNIFLPPTLSISPAKISPGDFIKLFGQSVPSAKVITRVDTDTSNALAADADGTGLWALQLDSSSLQNGAHSAKAFFTITNSTKSGFGKAVSFFIGNQPGNGAAGPSDLNGDGKVNLVDFSIFLLSWNTHDAASDFNGDGIVNLADFSIMLFAWTG